MAWRTNPKYWLTISPDLLKLVPTSLFLDCVQLCSITWQVAPPHIHAQCHVAKNVLVKLDIIQKIYILSLVF
jgi:hypothetical protein